MRSVASSHNSVFHGSNVMSHKSESPSTLLKQIDDEYKNSFLPVVLPQNRLDALLAVRPDLRYWRGKGKHCLVFTSPPLPIKKDPSSRPDRLGMANGRLKILRALPLQEKITLAYRVLDRMFAVTHVQGGGPERRIFCATSAESYSMMLVSAMMGRIRPSLRRREVVHHGDCSE